MQYAAATTETLRVAASPTRQQLEASENAAGVRLLLEASPSRLTSPSEEALPECSLPSSCARRSSIHGHCISNWASEQTGYKLSAEPRETRIEGNGQCRLASLIIGRPMTPPSLPNNREDSHMLLRNAMPRTTLSMIAKCHYENIVD